jgi:hypothetical protein
MAISLHKQDGSPFHRKRETNQLKCCKGADRPHLLDFNVLQRREIFAAADYFSDRDAVLEAVLRR